MSTYDWVEQYRGVCRCGAGEFVVEYGTPDHSYPTKSHIWRLTIACRGCKQRYRLVRQDGKTLVVSAKDVKRREQLEREWSRRYEEVLKSRGTVALLSRLEAELKKRKSVAAMYRACMAR